VQFERVIRGFPAFRAVGFLFGRAQSSAEGRLRQFLSSFRFPFHLTSFFASPLSRMEGKRLYRQSSAALARLSFIAASKLVCFLIKISLKARS